MKQLKPNSAGRLPGGSADGPSLAKLRAQRRAQRETNQRVEELKLRVLRFTEQHMEQAVRLIKRWLAEG
ncbi:MAG: flagellar M-ring protein FliF [Desulfovibrio sp.]|nr:flagellar M-ring protein FliF [Desulfovibrio sp.]MBO6171211.1 flagellar M-ring protein FliF [Desulfovibrio sp.]